MPSSYIENVPVIVEAVRRSAPEVVVDVGVGRGKYGYLIREYLGEHVHLVGVEAWAPYVANPSEPWAARINAVYSQLWRVPVEQVPDFNWTTACPPERRSMILLIDVIEHLKKDAGYELLAHLLQITPASILVSTPLGSYPQGPVNGNPYEEHVSEWGTANFRGMGEAMLNLSSKRSCIVVLRPALELVANPPAIPEEYLFRAKGVGTR